MLVSRDCPLRDPSDLLVGTDPSDSYDIAGQLTSLTDPKSQMTQWQFNGAGQMVKKVYPGTTNNEENITYDSYGRLATFVSRRGQQTTLIYDYDGQPSYTYQYDPSTSEQTNHSFT